MADHQHNLMPYPTNLGDSVSLVLQKLGGGEVENTCLVHAATHLVCYGVGQAYPDGKPLMGRASHDFDRLPPAELKSCLERLEAGGHDPRHDLDDGGHRDHHDEAEGVSGTEGPEGDEGDHRVEAGSAGAFPWSQVVLTLIPLLAEWLRQR